ncbi:hypothetical protein D3C86_1631250 [compost metagenome]
MIGTSCSSGTPDEALMRSSVVYPAISRLLPSSTIACVVIERRRTTGIRSTVSPDRLPSAMSMVSITARLWLSSTTSGVTRTAVPAVTLNRPASWKPSTRT